MAEPMRCALDLRIEDTEAPAIDRGRLHAAIESTLAHEDMAGCSVSVVVVDRDGSIRLHGTHFEDPTVTDVMSFPDGAIDPETGREHLGDLAVCAAVAGEVAAERGVDPGEELILYVVHGLLHLLGYDDVDPDDRRDMWHRQRAILAEIGIAIEEEPPDA